MVACRAFIQSSDYKQNDDDESREVSTCPEKCFRALEPGHWLQTALHIDASELDVFVRRPTAQDEYIRVVLSKTPPGGS